MSGFPQFAAALKPTTISTTGATAPVNSWCLVTRNGNTTLNLPPTPAAGTMIGVQNRIPSALNRTLTVLPTSPDTIEGSTTGTIWNVVGEWVLFCYDGTQWDVLEYSNGILSAQLNNGGGGDILIGSFFQVRRGAPAIPFSISGGPLVVGIGNTNLDISMGAIRFSGGTLTCTAASFKISDATNTNIYSAVMTGTFAVTTNTTFNPNNGGMPALNVVGPPGWTVTITGTDLSTAADGSTVVSAAGGKYFYIGAMTLLASGLVP